MKKKVLAAILAATMVVGLTACGGSKDTTTTTPDAATEETTDDAAEAPAADASGMSFEIVSILFQQKFNGSGVHIACRLCRAHCRLTHFPALFF